MLTLMKNKAKILSVFLFVLSTNFIISSCEGKETPTEKTKEQITEKEPDKELETEIQKVKAELKKAQVELENIKAEKEKAKLEKDKAKKAEANAIKAKIEAEAKTTIAETETAKIKAELKEKNLKKEDFSAEELAKANSKLLEAEAELVKANNKLVRANTELIEANKKFVKANTELAEANIKLAMANVELAKVKAELAKKEAELAEAGTKKETDPELEPKPGNSGTPCGKYNYDPKNLACVTPVGNGNDGCLNSDGLFVSIRKVVSNPCNTKLAILDIEINLGIDIDDDFVENHCGYQGQPPSINPKISLSDAKIYFAALFGEKIGNEFGDLLNTNKDNW